ncbi:MAG: sigma-70 family RNA polymerase sigma factor [Candidatus Aminicenantes bacterium]|nr:sigma-70 family RNA polymerase sigma factor [Candidatus Aminicenantes bacterium]
MPEERVLHRKLVICRVGLLMRKDRDLSERELIELVKKGSKEAYQQIVSRYMKKAYYIALSYVHNHQDALDISQESFIKAFRKIRNFSIQKPFFPWFYKLMKNLCLDHLRRRSRVKEIPLDGIQVLDEKREDREMKEVLWRGIERLPFEQREVVILRYFQQLSYDEIAEMTEKPVGTVMSSLYYSKKRLKKIIGKYLGFE